ncbi:MAG: hypothetical protein KGR26_05070, partial [Cyanobacteria bacterium REEB65]|nr:hypothetical protein [Cyanobacteria bacterium REEB65]
EVTFAYLGGETTKALPGGIYFQNYLLGKLSGHPAAFGVATSLVLVGLEAAVLMAFVLAFGIPGWPWLRPLLLGFSAAWIVLLFILWRSGLVGNLAEWSKGRHPAICRVMRQADLLYRGLVSIWHPLLWLELFALTVGYLFLNCIEFWLIAGANPAGHPLSLSAATAATSFSMLLPMMLPVPIQLGLNELTGTGALVAMGVPLGQSISWMFALRFWATGLVFPTALPLMAILHDEWRRVLWTEGHPPHAKPPDPCD